MHLRDLALIGLFVLSSPFFAATAFAEEVPVDLFAVRHFDQPRLELLDLPVTFRGAGFFLVEWDAKQQAAANEAGIAAELLLRDIRKDQQLFLFELHDGEEPPPEWNGRVLWRSGRSFVLAVDEGEAQYWAHHGLHPVRLGHEPRGWARPQAEFLPYDCTYDPLVAGILSKTNQAQWLDWIEKLSGVESVVVDGTQRTIQTRFSSSLFNGATNAKAYDFIRQQALSWNWPPVQIEDDPYTGTSGQTWKNLVLTIPGETSPSQEVLLTGHLDSLWQFGSSTTSAPGANDNGTGIATLLEAARILRQYRFQRTIKIVFFTGEEQGLYGSAAYTQDHPMGGVLGVVNLDMFGWDSNGDRCFEIHAGTLSQSQDVGNCFRDSIYEYSTGLNRDYLTTTATNRSDHASFWNVNVGAIEIAENYFNDAQPGGCVGSDANPNYHTNNDTIAQNMTPSFAFDIARTALATISSMAIPIEPCLADTAVVSATPSANAVQLSWSSVPGAVSYRVYRSTQGCEGQWLPITETVSTSYTDSGLTQPATYSYFVEAVSSNGFCVSGASNCASAVPTIYHAKATSATYADSCPGGGAGSGNGVIEPGETFTMAVTLLNDGNSPLTGLVGALSSTTTGVTVTDPSAAWPDLEPGTSSSTLLDHFGFFVDPTVACGTTIQLQVGSTANEGAWADPFAALVGSPANVPATRNSTDVPKAILDVATIQSMLDVPDAAAVVDVNVGLSLTHTYDGDLDIFLVGPNGTRVELSTDNGSSGDNFTNTVFDDEAATAVTAGAAPFTGSYRPEGLLSVLDGISALGTWRLEITDDAGSDTGTLLSWRLELTLAAPPICNVCETLAPPGEVSTVVWSPGDKTTLEWTSAPGAVTYHLYRGVDLDLSKLLDASVDSCNRLSTPALASGPVLAEDPASGAFFWFLVRAENPGGLGPAGNATAGPRIHDPSGICP